MDWLLDVPPHQAKEFLMSNYELGVKTVECILLLTLQQKALHIDRNVGRVFSHLGWVALKQLQEGEEFNEIKEYVRAIYYLSEYLGMNYTIRLSLLASLELDGLYIEDYGRAKLGRRTEHQLESKDVDDLCPHLFAESVERDDYMHEEDAVYGTILIPVRTTTRGMFSLNGTFFQANEVILFNNFLAYTPIELYYFFNEQVFADDESSEVLIKVLRVSLNESSNHGSVLWKQYVANMQSMTSYEVQKIFGKGKHTTT
ncbi:hypothetical protein OROMI_002817 [Orobanche minor]